MSELVVKNPYSGQELGRLKFATDKEIAEILKRATSAFEKWRLSPAWERAQLLLDAANALEARRDEFAQLICEEAGKPIAYARVEVDRGIGVLRWSAGEAQRFGGELLRLDATSAGRPGFGIHTRFPRGVVLGITPFNFPLNLVLHKVAPALACGCTIIVKTSPSTPLTSLRMLELFKTAGTADLVQVALADDYTTSRMTRAPEVAMISFTGSARVAAQIRRQSFEKPLALELGGNAWVILMEDTPAGKLGAIAERISRAAYGYAGQSCISVQNVAVAESLWPEFRELLSKATEATPFGNPALPNVISGPVIKAEAAERIWGELAKAPSQSTLIQAKGETGPSLVPPSLVVLDEPAGADAPTLIQEEIFGPVMVAARFNQADELVGRINSSHYGLQAGVYTQNWATIEKLYRDLKVGGLVVNDVPSTRYDHQPYGGTKDSGQGREGPRYAMEEMTESKFLALSSTIQS